MSSVPYPLGTAAELAETVRLVEAAGGAAVGMEVDVRSSSAVDAAVAAAIEQFGRIDALVANAGVTSMAPIVDVTDEQWAEVVDTNLTGVFHCLRAVVPHMRARQFGRIVVTSSMGGRMGIPNIGHYNATKWGVIGLAKSLALEVVRDGITVNVVAPCTVRTPMVVNGDTFALFSPDSDDMEEVLERFRRVNPIPEPWLEPEDVTREVLHLLTEPGRISGAVIEIGLGSSARLH
jgi:NAD(P)-dependent dehydrogenase (short-subunit alcohol dehydrogenase family)